MRQIVGMNAVAFQKGEKFKFPNDEIVYRFKDIEFVDGTPIVYYYEYYKLKYRVGCYLSDLIKIK